MSPVAHASLADYALKCCQDLRQDCQKVQDVRQAEFRAKPLAQRVGFYACQILQYGGMGVAVASLTIGTMISLKFFLVAAAAGVVFVVGVLARSRFETTNFAEDVLIQSFNNPDPLGLKMNPLRRRFAKPHANLHPENKDKLPKAEELQAARALFIDDVAMTPNAVMDNLQQASWRTCTFVDFIGCKGLSDKLKAKLPLTPEEMARKEHVVEKIRQVKVVYTTTLLLEAIQHVVSGHYTQAKQNAAVVQVFQGSDFPPELKQKLTLLADKLREPNKQLQDKIVKAVGPKFKLSDLDTVHAALAG